MTMPNHVSTKLTITGDVEQLATFLATHIVEEPCTEFEKKYAEGAETKTDAELDAMTKPVFDFNTVSFCHPDLTKAVSPRRTGEDLLRAKTRGDSQEHILELMKEIKFADDNVKNHGYANWYDFCAAEWGTKWGAYELVVCTSNEDCLELSYDTAWSPATPVLTKLSKMYPKLNFEQHVLDEGMGFAGTQEFKDGEYNETLYDGSAMYRFCNDEFGHTYEQCKCGEWFQAEWTDDGHDDTMCYDCNEEVIAANA
jgi:hypothetical protein